MKLRLLVMVSVLALTATALVGAPASAAPGDTVENPGVVTLVVNAGGALNLGGNAITLPSTATPRGCSNGTNDDVAVDDDTKQQDLNIDFDGGASNGVDPPTAVDAQCVAGGGFTSAQDDSEVASGNQTRQYITLTASVASDGTISATQPNIVFPQFYVYSAGAAGVITVIPKATGPASGHLDPESGEASLHVDWQLEVVQAFFGIDCASQISMDLSTDPSDPANSGPLPVAPVPYNTTDGSVTVSGNNFVLGAMAPANSRTSTTGVATATSTTFTDPNGNFTAADVNRPIYIEGAGTGGAQLATRVNSVTNSTTVVLRNAAVTSVNPASWYLGTQQNVCTTVGNGFGAPSPAGGSMAQLGITANRVFLPGAPGAEDDPGFTTPANTPLVVGDDGVLGNDVGVGLEVTGNSDPANGTATVSPGGGFTYTPDGNYAGPDSFTYTVTDDYGRTDTATVSVDVESTVPLAPTIGTATAGNGQATVTWTAPAWNGGSALTGYDVIPYIGATAQPAQSFDATATSRTVIGLTNGTAYTFKVIANNANGPSPESGESNSVTPAAPTAGFVNGPNPSQSGTFTPVPGDFNDDGFGDIYWYGGGAGTDQFQQGSSGATFSNATAPQQTTDYTPVPGDFNGDGAGDIYWYAPGSVSERIWLGDAGGITISTTMNAYGTYVPRSGDFDGDGDDDIFWYGPGGVYDSVWLGSPAGTFTAIRTRSQSGNFSPVVGDYDGDGKSDIYWYAAGATAEQLWRGVDGLTFTPVATPAVNATYTVLGGDFSGDGKSDLFFYAPGPGAEVYQLGTPTGFTPGTPKSVSGTYTPIVLDVDGDAHSDIYWYGPGSAFDSLYLGT